ERLGAGTRTRGGEEADLVLRMAARGWTCAVAGGASVDHLEWRDDAETMGNLLGYQRGAGVYLGAALRRDTRRAVKPFVLRIHHEIGHWRREHGRATSFGPRMTAALVSGLARGAVMKPQRFMYTPTQCREPARRPRVLWVTDEPPDRAQGGGNIRQAMLLD